MDGLLYTRELATETFSENMLNNKSEEYLNGLLSEMIEEIINNKKKYE